ncbi:alpha-amylase family glycosyl hydrolase [Ignavibacteria bacterium 4148-Me]|uniref:alpha-amylase family glycosyl hydrolase n=1 Tax=Rosettibacter primus TaxID=3111523 RepID=UPI00336BDA6A
MNLVFKYFLTIVIIYTFSIYGIDIKFDKVYGNEVWSHVQFISGIVSSNNFSKAELFLNGNTVDVIVKNDFTFSVEVNLDDGVNEIFIVIDSSGYKFISDTLILKLGYKILPEVYAYAEVIGNNVRLKKEVITNPKNVFLKFLWKEDINNPLAYLLTNSYGEEPIFQLPLNAPDGEYYYNLITITSGNDTVKSRTYITKRGNTIIPFDIKKARSEWIDKAIIYQVAPYIFVENGKIKDVKEKIPELYELGINTIYLQPIFPTYNKGQGYDVTDYFKIRQDYGNENDLRELITEARKYKIHVILDFVINHSSIYHPFAQHSLKYGSKSYYYNFYQRMKGSGNYLSDLQLSSNGFYYYFDWSNMPNWNHNNPETEKYLIEAAKYWVANFDIDGFRFDAVWATNDRSPNFTKKLRFALKRIKPEILLIAEDKASQPQVFDERFDVAYDWTPEYWWVSHWSWATDIYGSKTIFNQSNITSRVNSLRNALTNNGNGFSQNAKILRFMENNDTYRFMENHSLEQTKMVAALLMTLNGVPMIFNGQEIGKKGHPYNDWMIFWPSNSIKSLDKYKLFEHYKYLLSLRKKYNSITSDNFEELFIDNNSFIYGFRRWINKENIFVVLNLSFVNTESSMKLPINKLNLDSAQCYYITNLLDGKTITGKSNELSNINLKLGPYECQIYLLTDTVVTIVSAEDNKYIIPKSLWLSQNYPNPFNPSTSIDYYLPDNGNVKLSVYDLLGKEISTLFNEYKTAGYYRINFEPDRLSSGVYFYSLEFNGNKLTRKMLFLK